MFKKIVMILSMTLLLLSEDNIEVYSAYGSANHIKIEGRMLHKRVFKDAKERDGWFKNFYRRAKQLSSNEIKNSFIAAIINSSEFSTKGDSEGYFRFDINLKYSLKRGYKDIYLSIKNSHKYKKIKATIIDNKRVVGIISDFDDTLIISNVTNKLKLFSNVAFKNYKQRTAVYKMRDKFAKILARNPKNTPSTLFILSGSPQQLHSSIEDFLKLHRFPPHVLILKKIHGDNKDPLTNQFAYKMSKIESLIRLYPNMTWVLFGDSGEKDKEVYSALKKRYPHRIEAFYIRDVKNGSLVHY